MNKVDNGSMLHSAHSRSMKGSPIGSRLSDCRLGVARCSPDCLACGRFSKSSAVRVMPGPGALSAPMMRSLHLRGMY